MAVSRHILVALILALLAAPITHAQPAEPPAGFRALFNGTDLEGWWGCGTEDPRAWMAISAEQLEQKIKDSRDNIAQHWSVNDGVLINDGHGLFLTTNDNFEDFELLVEYRTVAGADSGIYLRGIPQVQIWDTTEEGGKWNIGADKGSGGLWNNAPGMPGKDPSELMDKPFGEWNRFRIIMIGDRVTVEFNDVRVVDHAVMDNYFNRDLPVPRSGPIQLQTHGGEIQWRNVFIRTIETNEANHILRNNGPDRFVPAHTYTSLFDGTSFEGWNGPTDNYSIVDGALRCKPGRGGTIYHEDTFDDFEMRFQFKLPPGGNNGVAIRYPGQGDAAYTGMCELQVLDNTAEKYANLDPRQYHGSVYGQAPAARGYLRPTGEWNSQSITVNGSRITVELNGSVILDADTASIESFMYDAKQFAGRTRTSGHVGFCGHSDPVAFRNVEIRRLSPAADANRSSE